MASDAISVLFVCLGNICRSPTAEGVFRHILAQEGLEDRFRVDSAGTGAWHVGESPDRRATATARERGIALSGQARKVRPEDFREFDWVLAMDTSNLHELQEMKRQHGGDAEVRLFREFEDGADPDTADPDTDDLDVPDPYYGGDRGFERVFDLVERACRGFLDHVLEDDDEK